MGKPDIVWKCDRLAIERIARSSPNSYMINAGGDGIFVSLLATGGVSKEMQFLWCMCEGLAAEYDARQVRGAVEWKTGENAGLVSEIKESA